MGEDSVIVLQLAEGAARDAGRGLARLDPTDMVRLVVGAGDVIEITGKRATAARAIPAYPLDRGKATIQVDGATRRNTLAGPGDEVRVRRATWAPAGQVSLNPLSSCPTRDPGYLARLLDGLPVVAGDVVRITPVGGRAITFQIEEAYPVGIVLIHPGTVVHLNMPKAPPRPGGFSSGGVAALRDRDARVMSGGVSYDDIGGLDPVMRKIREMIELPLLRPEVFDRLGIDPPRGILLHGAPGCGKTLIARAVAGETSAAFIAVNGPEIIHKFYGESEAHLRSIFEEARRRAPSIIFLDEIDAIAPKRTDAPGEVEKRVVAQLLALMDGMEDRGRVVVIGATNLPEHIDPALRRPGRFDREIPIPIPDRPARLAILRIHTRGMPLVPDVDLEHLAEVTHGFVGADLAALCREAAMTALHRLLPAAGWEAGNLPMENLLSLAVGMNDFLAVLKEIEPSAIREVFTEVPSVGWEDIGGLEEAKQALREAAVWPLAHADLFRQVGVRPPRGILLHGPPGTGKTLLAKAVAHESGVNFIAVNGPSLLSKYVGESERAVRDVFRKARQASPCIVFFDELDSLAPPRGSHGGEGGVSERVMGQILTEIDGVQELEGVLVLGATNRPDLIDPALLRSGRFDLKIEIPPPDRDGRIGILRIHTRRMPLGADVSHERLAEVTAGCSGADLRTFCQQAAMGAIREVLASGALGLDPQRRRIQVAWHHFEAAWRHFEPGLAPFRAWPAADRQT